jgi:putative ABC transport system permease protein
LVRGTVSDYLITSTFDFKEGRFFNELESRDGANVCVIGYDVADALFPSASPIDKSVLINGQPFKVIGVISRQGSFLGLFSLDSIVVMPLPAFQKYFTAKSEAEILVKVKDKTKLADAKDELTGLMRRVRGLSPEKRDDFSINEQQALKSTLDPIKNSIAIAGLFITGLSLFVGAIGIMNITFVSVKERTKEIGTRKALGARNVLRNRQSLSVFSDSLFIWTRPRQHDRVGDDRLVFRIRAGMDGVTSRSGDGSAVRMTL